MLVLSIAAGEGLVIGDAHLVTVAEIVRSRIRIQCTDAQNADQSRSIFLFKKESVEAIPSVHITFVECNWAGDKARIGIVAPRDVPVCRKEVWDAVHGGE